MAKRLAEEAGVVTTEMEASNGGDAEEDEEKAREARMANAMLD